MFVHKISYTHSTADDMQFLEGRRKSGHDPLSSSAFFETVTLADMEGLQLGSSQQITSQPFATFWSVLVASEV